MDWMELSRDATRLERDRQYLKVEIFQCRNTQRHKAREIENGFKKLILFFVIKTRTGNRKAICHCIYMKHGPHAWCQK